jgi:hypothetical protein
MLLHTSPNDTLDFIIVGCCRSGTGYMSALFTACGYDVGHERLGKHGISSWCWAVTDTTTPGSGLPRKPTAASASPCGCRRPWRVCSRYIFSTDWMTTPSVTVIR